MLVVETFSGDNMRFNTYASIGWGEYYLLEYRVTRSESANGRKGEKEQGTRAEKGSLKYLMTLSILQTVKLITKENV